MSGVWGVPGQEENLNDAPPVLVLNFEDCQDLLNPDCNEINN
jgi:hypothetical protein